MKVYIWIKFMLTEPFWYFDTWSAVLVHRKESSRYKHINPKICFSVLFFKNTQKRIGEESFFEPTCRQYRMKVSMKVAVKNVLSLDAWMVGRDRHAETKEKKVCMWMAFETSPNNRREPHRKSENHNIIVTCPCLRIISSGSILSLQHTKLPRISGYSGFFVTEKK